MGKEKQMDESKSLEVLHDIHDVASPSPHNDSPTKISSRENSNSTDDYIIPKICLDEIELSNLPNSLPPTEHCIAIDNETDKPYRYPTPKIRNASVGKDILKHKESNPFSTTIKPYILMMSSLFALTSASAGIFFATKDYNHGTENRSYATLLSLLAGITLQITISLYASERIKRVQTRFYDYITEEGLLITTSSDLLSIIDLQFGPKLISTYCAMRTGMMLTELLQKIVFPNKHINKITKFLDDSNLPVSWSRYNQRNIFNAHHYYAELFCKNAISESSRLAPSALLKKYWMYYIGLSLTAIGFISISRTGFNLPEDALADVPAIMFSNLGFMMLGIMFGLTSFHYLPERKAIENFLAFSLSLVISISDKWYSPILSSFLGVVFGYNIAKASHYLDKRRNILQQEMDVILPLLQNTSASRLALEAQYETLRYRENKSKKNIYFNFLQFVAFIIPPAATVLWWNWYTLPTYAAGCYMFLSTYHLGKAFRLNPIMDIVLQSSSYFKDKLKLMFNYLIEENLMPFEIMTLFATKWRTNARLKIPYGVIDHNFLISFNPIYFAFLGALMGIKKSEGQYLQHLSESKVKALEMSLESNTPFSKNVFLTKAEVKHLYFLVNNGSKEINRNKSNLSSIKPLKEAERLKLRRHSLPNSSFFKLAPKDMSFEQSQSLKGGKASSLMRSTLFVPATTNSLNIHP